MKWKILNIETNAESIIENKLTIGRTTGDLIFSQATKMSRTHAHFIEEEENVYLVDLESTNGTLLNGQKIAPQVRTKLANGDKIQIAEIVFKIIGEEAEIEVESEPEINEPVAMTASENSQKMEIYKNWNIQYTGEAKDLFILMAKNFIFTLLSFGLYIPYALTNLRKYFWSHFVLEKQSLYYRGTGKELLKALMKISLVVILYSVIIGIVQTFLIPAPLAALAMGVIGIINSLLYFYIFARSQYGSRAYQLNRTSYRGIRFRVNPDGFKPFFKAFVIGVFLSIVTLGFYLPYHLCKLDTIKWNNTSYGTKNFIFEINGKEYFKVCLMGLFLSFITFGIYAPWFFIKLHRMRMKALRFENLTFDTKASGFDYFIMLLKTTIVLILTLGLGFPWYLTQNIAFFIKNLKVEGQLDFAQLSQEIKIEAGSSDDQLSSYFDMDAGIGII
jgi:uncharacterized membrane protein YjgN (DUF898 family)